MKKTMNAYQLKVIALIFMILDHVHTYLFYGVWPQWISLLPRFVAPLFLYLMVEGYHYTRSRKRYALRLFGAAAVMFVGNAAINIGFHNVDLFTGRFTLYSIMQGHNIFLTLGLLFVVIWMIDGFRDSGDKGKKAVLGILCGALSLFLEGGIYLLPLAVVFILCYGKEKQICLFITGFSVLLFAKALYSYLSGSSGDTLMGTLCFDAEWTMILVIPFLHTYNGQRGRNTPASRNMFYILYPAHLWILCIFCFLNQ